MAGPPASPVGILRIRALAIGFATALVLLAVTVTLAAIAVTRLQHATVELARRSHESTYELGDVSGQLALMRGYVSLATRAPPPALDDLDRRIAMTNAGLEVSMGGLPEVLDEPSYEDWIRLEREIRDLRATLLQAFALARARRTLQSDAIMRGLLGPEIEIHDGLDRLEHRHRAATIASFRELDRAMLRVRVLEGFLGAMLIAGTIAIWLSIIRTLGRQRRQLAGHVERIEALNEDLDAFAGRVAHDLRNALTPLVTSAAMLRRSSDNPKTVAAVSERIERSSARAIALLDGLLAFSRSTWSACEEGETALVRKAVADALEDLQPLVERLQVQVDVECEDLCVQCPQGLISVVVANLCNNAVKFLEGCRQRLVRITARREDRTCVIAVEDSGPGIPQTAVGRIFEPFFRVPGARAAGTGMGLATVARVVDRCRGKVRVHSTVGRGSRFEVRLPLAEQPTT